MICNELNCSVFGSNSLAVSGVESLIGDVCRDISLSEMYSDDTDLPDFWVFSSGDEKDVSPFMHVLHSDPESNCCIIFGDSFLKSILFTDNFPRVIAVLDVYDSILSLKNELKMVLELFIRKGNAVCRCRHNVPALRFSSLETRVLNLIMHGESIFNISYKTGLHSKKIYVLKRKIMLKMRASTNQELFSRALMTGFRYEFTSDALACSTTLKLLTGI